VSDLSDILLPPERISVSEAAAKYRHVYNPPVVNALWDNSIASYLEEVMNTLESRDFTAVCFVSAAQSLKTEIIQNWLAYSVVCDPSDMLIVEKSMIEAKKFSQMKLDRTLRHSPELSNRLIQRRTADNVFDKQFKSGAFLNITWPTVNAASGKTIRRVAITDYDRHPTDLGGEGSGFDLFGQRPKVYKRLGMTYVESSPSFDVIDHQFKPKTLHEAPPCEAGIVPIYNRGDRRRRYWQCPHCRNWFEPSFSLLRWVDSADLMECAESVYLACPHCFLETGAMIRQHMRQELDYKGVWLKDGEIIDKNGTRGGKPRRSDIASFWLKGPATAFGQWKIMVHKYLTAMEEYATTGNDRPLKTTVNTEQGEVFIAPRMMDTISPEDLMSRAKDIGARVVPEGVRFLVATIDVQKSKFVVQVQGIKPAVNTVDMVVIDRFDILKSERRDEDGERYLVNPASYSEDWDLITDRVIERSYPLDDESGRRMAIRMVGCDSGGRLGVTPRAYEYFRKLKKEGYGSRFFLLKGGSEYKAPRVQKVYPDSERKDRNAGARGEIPLLLMNTDILKDWVYSVLGRVEPGAGYIEFPDWLTLDFYKELCVESRNQKGRWENLKKLRNESWDLLTYCYAVCLYLRAEKINWDDPDPLWARKWDENNLVFDEGSSDIRNETGADDLSETLKKLAKMVG
jgi:phage terminase large subunit GpA-like protein